jgi:hypothetical protein
MIVSVAVAVPKVALLGLESVRLIVSLLSPALSSRIAMLMPSLVSPGAKVSVPLLAV